MLKISYCGGSKKFKRLVLQSTAFHVTQLHCILYQTARKSTRLIKPGPYVHPRVFSQLLPQTQSPTI